MQVVRRANVNHVDVGPRDEFLPVGFDGLVAPLVGKLLRLSTITGTRCLQDHLVGRREKLPDLLVGIGMGTAHEAVADHADVQCFRCHRRKSHFRCYLEGDGSQNQFVVSKTPLGYYFFSLGAFAAKWS